MKKKVSFSTDVPYVSQMEKRKITDETNYLLNDYLSRKCIKAVPNGSNATQNDIVLAFNSIDRDTSTYRALFLRICIMCFLTRVRLYNTKKRILFFCSFLGSWLYRLPDYCTTRNTYYLIAFMILFFVRSEDGIYNTIRLTVDANF